MKNYAIGIFIFILSLWTCQGIAAEHGFIPEPVFQNRITSFDEPTGGPGNVTGSRERETEHEQDGMEPEEEIVYRKVDPVDVQIWTTQDPEDRADTPTREDEERVPSPEDGNDSDQLLEDFAPPLSEEEPPLISEENLGDAVFFSGSGGCSLQSTGTLPALWHWLGIFVLGLVPLFKKKIKA